MLGPRSSPTEHLSAYQLLSVNHIFIIHSQNASGSVGACRPHTPCSTATRGVYEYDKDHGILFRIIKEFYYFTGFIDIKHLTYEGWPCELPCIRRTASSAYEPDARPVGGIDWEDGTNSGVIEDSEARARSSVLDIWGIL